MKKILSKQPLFVLVTLLAALIFAAGRSSTESRRSTGRYIDDQSVNARVKTALFEDEDVSGFDISTTTFEGVVQLSGFVDESFQKDRAGEIASGIDGVHSVINNISVKSNDTQYGGRDAETRSEQSDRQRMEESDANRPGGTQLNRDREESMAR